MTSCIPFHYLPLLLLTALFVLSIPSPLASSIPKTGKRGSWRVDNLQCEYRTNPLGIDAVSPRLQWIVESEQRDQYQTAYRILVASTPEILAQDHGDIWDSGKVHSAHTNQIAYSGRALRSNEPCYWKVQSWNADGNVSEWSSVAEWSIGLLKPSDWKANWIGYDAAYREAATLLNVGELSWISLPEGSQSPNNSIYARRSFAISPEIAVAMATLVLYCDNEATAYVNGNPVGNSFRWEPTALLDCTQAVRAGTNVVAIACHNTDFLPAQVIGEIVVSFEDGSSDSIVLDQFSKVAGVEIPGWSTERFDDQSWADAATGGAGWHTALLCDTLRTPTPYLRKTFSLSEPIGRATLFVSALGLYEMHINGQRVGQNYLTPGWTDYRQRVHYQTYDVTQLLHEGPNAAGSLLGDGWYSGALGFSGKRNWYGGNPRLLAEIIIEHPDGTTETISTDPTWKASFGPFKQADLFLGDVYDAQDQLTGWDLSGYNDKGWSQVDVGRTTVASNSTDVTPAAAPPPPSELIIQADPSDPIHITDELKAVNITEPSPGFYTFDLGQNMVGWTRLIVSGKPGQKITVRHGEMLNPDGTVYQANLRSATGTDIYYLKGGSPEVLEPVFTLKGFQYVEVRGLTSTPTLDTVTGIVVHNDMQRTGTFSCSSPLINQLYHNIIWGQKGNYVSVPTDCPQRDERLGWTGDTEFFMRTGAYNYDVAPFFTSWLMTMCEDSQYPDGSFANVAPDADAGNGSTAWGDAALQCTYHMYEVYGDTEIIRAHYSAMSRYMDFLAAHSTNHVANVGGFGDWLNLGGGASAPVIDTAYYCYLSEIMSKMAGAIGNKADAERYSQLHANIRATFIKNFIQPDGSILDSSQTAYALAFTMGLVPDDQRGAMAGQFVDQLKRFDWHLATGFIGTPRLLPALHKAGLDNDAYKVLLQDTYPGWLFQVKLGATTMWERWDGWTPDRGFQSTTMNSFNHYAFGAVGRYLYANVAGIDTDGPGFSKIVIRPEIEPGLTSAKATYDSINGVISSAWILEGKQLILDITIPANTSATVYIPSADGKVTEGSTSAAEAIGVKVTGHEGDSLIYHVGCGVYHFHSIMP